MSYEHDGPRCSHTCTWVPSPCSWASRSVPDAGPFARCSVGAGLCRAVALAEA